MILSDLARVVRSKNAGPTLLTIDVMFATDAAYQRGQSALTQRRIAETYGRALHEVSVLSVAAARAVKIVLPREVPAGAPGDKDVYGAQQHAPLLDLQV